MIEEKCLKCKWVEILEITGSGFIGETVLHCKICEEDTEDKDDCFEQ